MIAVRKESRTGPDWSVVVFSSSGPRFGRRPVVAGKDECLVVRYAQPLCPGARNVPQRGVDELQRDLAYVHFTGPHRGDQDRRLLDFPDCYAGDLRRSAPVPVESRLKDDVGVCDPLHYPKRTRADRNVNGLVVTQVVEEFLREHLDGLIGGVAEYSVPPLRNQPGLFDVDHECPVVDYFPAVHELFGACAGCARDSL